MEKPSSPTGTVLSLLRNESGAVLVITAFMVVILTLLFAGMVELGRVMIIRERTQTAADAASLASALSEVKRMVKVEVTTSNRGRIVRKCDDNGCRSICKSIPDSVKIVTGREDDLIENGGWKNYKNPGECGANTSSYRILDRWVEYDKPVKTGKGDTAEVFFNANYPRGASEAEIKKIDVYNDPGHPAYPSVVVYAQAKIKSLFPNLFNNLFRKDPFPDEYTIINCSQASTYYKDPDSGKMSRPPEDWCWVDW